MVTTKTIVDLLTLVFLPCVLNHLLLVDNIIVAATVTALLKMFVSGEQSEIFRKVLILTHSHFVSSGDLLLFFRNEFEPFFLRFSSQGLIPYLPGS